MFPINKLDALIDGIIDQWDSSEDVVKACYCLSNRKKGMGRREREGGREGGSEGERKEKREGGKEELQVGGRNSGSKYKAKLNTSEPLIECSKKER